MKEKGLVKKSEEVNARKRGKIGRWIEKKKVCG